MSSAGTGISHSEYNKNPEQQVHFLQIWVKPETRRLSPKYYTRYARTPCVSCITSFIPLKALKFRHFSDDEKKDKLIKIVAPLASSPSVIDSRQGKGPIPIHAGVSVYASILSPGARVSRAFPFTAIPLHSKPGAKERKAYVHVAQTSGYSLKATPNGARLRLNNELEIGEGNGAFVSVTSEQEGRIELNIDNVGETPAEFLVFDIQS